MVRGLERPLLAAALLLALPLAVVAGEHRLVEIEEVDVLRGRVRLVGAGGLELLLPDGEYIGPGVRFLASSSRIEAVHLEPRPAEGGTAARPAAPRSGPLHPVVETAWVRDGRLFLANRRGEQLELRSGAYVSPRGVTLEIRDRRIRSIRASNDLLHEPGKPEKPFGWGRLLRLLNPLSSRRPSVILP
jgi:hypothetical protein